jgi:hypothetical protein
MKALSNTSIQEISEWPDCLWDVIVSFLKTTEKHCSRDWDSVSAERHTEDFRSSASGATAHTTMFFSVYSL